MKIIFFYMPTYHFNTIACLVSYSLFVRCFVVTGKNIFIKYMFMTSHGIVNSILQSIVIIKVFVSIYLWNVETWYKFRTINIMMVSVVTCSANLINKSFLEVQSSWWRICYSNVLLTHVIWNCRWYEFVKYIRNFVRITTWDVRLLIGGNV